MPKDQPNVATPSGLYDLMEQWRALPRLLMGGTRELRKAENAKLYLPPEDDEETSNLDLGPESSGRRSVGRSEWQQRVDRSVVEPFFSRAVRRAVSAILAKPVVLNEDVPPQIRGTRADPKDGWWENIDLEGNDGNVFFSRVAEDSLGDAGVSYTMVEHQRVPQKEDGSSTTNADLGKLRPYVVHVKACQVINRDVEVVNGRKRDRVVRISEEYTVEDGNEWERKTAPQIRVLRAPPLGPDGQPLIAEGDDNPRGYVTWETWRKTKDDDEDSWAIHEQGKMSPHHEIPLVPYCTGYIEWGKARCPFDDLAHLNMLHTQKASDIGENFRVSLGAQLHRAGISLKDAKEQRAIGAKRLLVSTEAGATAEWLERTGSAAKIAMEDQDRLEARMLALSHEPHVRRTGTETATGRAIDAAEAKTETQAWAIGMRDHIEQVLMFMAGYRDLETGGSVDVQLPPRHSEQDIEALKVLVDMHVKTGGVPRAQTILEAMKRQGWLPDDFDVEAEAASVEQSMDSGPEGRLRALVRPLAERSGMSEEEIDALLDDTQPPPPGGTDDLGGMPA